MPARCPPISVSLRQPLSPETLWEPGLGRRELLAWRGSLEHWQTPTLPPFLNLPWGGGGSQDSPALIPQGSRVLICMCPAHKLLRSPASPSPPSSPAPFSARLSRNSMMADLGIKGLSYPHAHPRPRPQHSGAEGAGGGGRKATSLRAASPGEFSTRGARFSPVPWRFG